MEISANFCIEYLKREQIQINYDEFNNQIRSHPHYPSLLAISETLDFFRIKHTIGRLESLHISHLPDRFAALIEKADSGQFNAYIERTNIGFRYLENHRWKSVDPSQFKKIFRNIILVLEHGDILQKKISVTKDSIFIFFAGFAYLGLLLCGDLSRLTMVFAFLSIVGLFFAIEVVGKELGFDTPISQKICNISLNTECLITDSKNAKKYLSFLSIGEPCAIYFGSQLITLLCSALSNNVSGFYTIFFASSILSIPISLYSIYRQYFIVKKWCPICLGIIAVLFVQLISLLAVNNLGFSLGLNVVLQLLLSLLIPTLMINYAKSQIQKDRKNQSEIIELHRFKRNYGLFRLALHASDQLNVDANFSHKIILGNPAAKLKITVVTSPFCAACEKFHHTITALLDRFSDELAFDIRFLFDQELSSQATKNTYSKLISIYLLNGAKEFFNSLATWFETKDFIELAKKSPSINDETLELIEVILNEQCTWGRAQNIEYTPSLFINEYRFPIQYGLQDISYFIEDLIEDSESLIYRK